MAESELEKNEKLSVEKQTQYVCEELPETLNIGNNTTYLDLSENREICTKSHTDQGYEDGIESNQPESSVNQQGSEERREGDTNEHKGSERQQRGDQGEKEGGNGNEGHDGESEAAKEDDKVSILVGLLNVQSITNKGDQIFTFLSKKKLDVFLTTETWLRKDEEGEVLLRMSQENFDFCHPVRDGVGGGVTMQFLNELQVDRSPFDLKINFECVITALKHPKWEQDILVINVYFPPKYTSTNLQEFLKELQMLLDKANTRGYDNIIVSGDFNIWAEIKTKMSVTEFESFLRNNGLVQQEHDPTCQSDSSVDLIISRNVEVSDCCVWDNGVSDHHAMYFTARPKKIKNDI